MYNIIASIVVYYIIDVYRYGTYFVVESNQSDSDENQKDSDCQEGPHHYVCNIYQVQCI